MPTDTSEAFTYFIRLLSLILNRVIIIKVKGISVTGSGGS
jgi:hypothetical protein